MKTQSPVESVMARMVTALSRGDLASWSERIFADDVVLEISRGGGTVRGPQAVTEHLEMAAAGGRPPESTILAAGATLRFPQVEVYLQMGLERIDAVWFYPPGEAPCAVLEAQGEQPADPSSCCCS